MLLGLFLPFVSLLDAIQHVLVVPLLCSREKVLSLDFFPTRQLRVHLLVIDVDVLSCSLKKMPQRGVNCKSLLQ